MMEFSNSSESGSHGALDVTEQTPARGIFVSVPWQPAILVVEFRVNAFARIDFFHFVNDNHHRRLDLAIIAGIVTADRQRPLKVVTRLMKIFVIHGCSKSRKPLERFEIANWR